MTAIDILRAVEAVGGRVGLASGGMLTVGAPSGGLTPDLLSLLRERKADIVAMLKSGGSLHGRGPIATEPRPLTNPQSSSDDPWRDLKRLPLLHGDREHIKKHIRGRSPTDQARIVAGYVQRWQEASGTEPVDFRRANAGRRAANAWLRKVAA